MPDFGKLFADFFRLVAQGQIEIYNEFSLQHELGIYLRTMIGADYRIQFERPTPFFGIERFGLEKKEIDISVFDHDLSSKYAVELKYPRNGRHPETMFDFCKDIRFLEQLAAGGFLRCYFVAVVDDSLFYEGKNTTGIYQYFRSDKPIHGVIEKPTGKNKYPLEIAGSYKVEWQPLKAAEKYFLVEIGC